MKLEFQFYDDIHACTHALGTNESFIGNYDNNWFV